MTLLVAFATKDYILFGADNRITQVDNESVYMDTKRKLFRMNDKVLIAFSGDYNITVSCIHFLQKQKLSNSTVQAVVRKIRQHIKHKYKEDIKMQQTVFVGGIGDGNKVTLISMSHTKEFELEKIIPAFGDIRWHTSYGDVNPMKFIENKVRHAKQDSEELDINTIGEITKDVFDFVGAQDKYVSPTHNIDYIIK